MIKIHNCAPISMTVILTIVIFICRWYENHIRISEINIHYMTFVFVGPRLQSPDFIVLMITKHMWLFSTNQVQMFKYISGL